MMENRLRRRHPIVQTVMDNWFYVLVLIFLIRFPYLVAEWTDSNVVPERVTGPNVGESFAWQLIMVEFFLLSMLAMSYNLMFGFTGVISFGHGLFFGIGAYVVPILIQQYEQTFVKAVVGALACGMVMGLIWSVAAFRLRGVYFAMFTLAFSEIFFELSQISLFLKFTNGDDGLKWERDFIPEWLRVVNTQNPETRLQVYNIALGCMVIVFLLIRRLMNSPTGKVLLAIRGNEVRAETLGFNVYIYKTIAIVISSLIATIAGIFHVIVFRQATPNTLSIEKTVDPLIHTLLGGTGTMPGPIIGAGLIRFGDRFWRRADLRVDLDFIIWRYTATVNGEEWWGVLLGATFVLFVMLIPFGIVGTVNKVWIEARRWFRRYAYNPVVKRYPKLATYAAPFTGEPPAFAIAVAQRPSEFDLLTWFKTYPIVTMNAITFGVAVTAGVVTWEWRNAVSVGLFLLLISVPIRIGRILQFLWGRLSEIRREEAQFRALQPSVASVEKDAGATAGA